MRRNNFAKDFLVDDQATGERTLKQPANGAWRGQSAPGRSLHTLDLYWTYIGITL